MRIIVTGGCGFVGSNLVESLLAGGNSITILDNLVRRGAETNVARLRKLGAEFVHGDIRNPEDLLELPTDADVLIECSAQPSVVSGYQNPLFDFRTNVEGVINCLEFCRRVDAGMIFLSSSRVYSAARINALPFTEHETRWDWDTEIADSDTVEGFDPVYGISSSFSLDGAGKTIYGASKAAADLFCREYADAFDVPVVVNRCGVIAGQGQFGVITQGWLTYWAISCFLERPLTYFGHKGKQVRDILFIDDLSRLVSMQVDRLEELSGAVWNVGGGRDSSLSLVEATALTERLLKKKMTIAYREAPRKGDMVIYLTDNRDVERDFGWSPSIAVEEGVERITRWVTDNRSLLETAGL